MRNFDILKDIAGLRTVYRYCSTAEDFQIVNPIVSAQNARLALETMVKTIYRLKGWQMGERANLLSLTTDERFVAFIDSSEMMRRIHYVRKIGNNAAHGGDYVGRRESFFAVLNLYYFIGSVLLVWQMIDTLPDFDKALIPQSLEPGNMAVTPSESNVAAATTEASEAVAEAVNENSNAQPETVNAQPVVSDLTEAETRRLYIDILLKEAGWKVTEIEGEKIRGQAGIEIEVSGMPSESGNGYADYVLFGDDGTPLAVVEAKRTNIDPQKGRHQAELYADCLKAQYGCPRPVIYYTNGFETNVIDGMGYPTRKVMGFHSQDELRRMIAQRGRYDITDLQISDRITNRPYQKRVITSVCKHYNKKRRRALLVMATGTGKTRVSISLVDVLVRNGWVKNVLFLADRIELVNQAMRNYAKLLPDMTVSSLRDDDVDINACILFSTYQTMIGHLDKDDKTFSIGRFDLVIIDEAHRSVFGKYGAIFDYFDTLLLGLTATPRDEVDRSTYELFGMEQGVPTDSYEYEEAVADGYLNDYTAIKDNSQILTEGIDPAKLSQEEREQLEEIFEYEKMMKGLDNDEGYSRTISANEIFQYIFNENTVDHVLNRLMEDGIRVKDGTMVGKTIIFDYYRNFDFFEMHPEGSQPTRQQSIVSLLFGLRTDIKYALQDGRYQSDEQIKALHDELVDTLYKQVDGLNRSRLDVRQQLKNVETFAKKEAMTCLTLGDVDVLKNNIAQLMKDSISDVSALKFDALMLRSQLSTLDPTINARSTDNKIQSIVLYLKEKKASIPQVQAKMAVIDEVLTPQFWEHKNINRLEYARVELRELIQYLEGEGNSRTFTVNITDIFEQDNTGVNIQPVKTYCKRAEDYLREHLPDDPALQKIYRLETLDDRDIAHLEQIFWHELGTQDEYVALTHANPYMHHVAAFIRSIIGLEKDAALEKYRQLIHRAELTRMQEEYLLMIIRYVSENGDIAPMVLQQPPFSNFMTIFRNSPASIINYVKMISDVISAGA